MRLLPAILCAAVCLTACESCPEPEPASPTKAISGQRDQWFVDGALRRKIAFGEFEAARDDAGRMRVSLPIRNLTSEALNLQVQIVFIDARGVPTHDETPRRYLFVPGGETRQFEALSRTPSSCDFRVYVWRERS